MRGRTMQYHTPIGSCGCVAHLWEGPKPDEDERSVYLDDAYSALAVAGRAPTMLHTISGEREVPFASVFPPVGKHQLATVLH